MEPDYLHSAEFPHCLTTGKTIESACQKYCTVELLLEWFMLLEVDKVAVG